MHRSLPSVLPRYTRSSSLNGPLLFRKQPRRGQNCLVLVCSSGWKELATFDIVLESLTDTVFTLMGSKALISDQHLGTPCACTASIGSSHDIRGSEACSTVRSKALLDIM